MPEPLSLEQIAAMEQPGFAAHTPVIARELIALRDHVSALNHKFEQMHAGSREELVSLRRELRDVQGRLDIHEEIQREHFAEIKRLEAPDAEPEPARVATTFVTQEVFDRAMRACGWEPDAEPDASLVAQLLTDTQQRFIEKCVELKEARAAVERLTAALQSISSTPGHVPGWIAGIVTEALEATDDPA